MGLLGEPMFANGPNRSHPGTVGALGVPMHGQLSHDRVGAVGVAVVGARVGLGDGLAVGAGVGLGVGVKVGVAVGSSVGQI